MLVPIQKWKCINCLKAGERFRHRKCKDGAEFKPNTPNVALSEEQIKQKLADQQREIKTLRQKTGRLENYIQLTIASRGVDIDDSLSESLTDVLKSQKLTPLQELFLQQQYRAASLKNAKCMRWHPTLIRFALHIKSVSSAAYSLIRESGIIRLPCERTLFDYSHVLPKVHGVNDGKIGLVVNHLSKFKEEDQKFHNLLMDEIHVSQKLVYDKASGQMIGYTHLDDVAEEMRFLVEHVTKGKGDDERPVATKILTYMIKGISNDVKETVAAYPTNSSLSKELLYEYTWDVISHLEIAGVKVLAVVCDGASTNRAFIDMHTPHTKTKSGVVFDTKNLCAKDRLLYFISDPPHLLKTLRNCFAKSGVNPKCKKLLTKNGQTIVWKTIERLFLEDHENTWRTTHKLHSMNVYLNSYSCMKVLYAAQVLSRTTGLDLKSRKWPGTSETVEFILKVNDFFDCLNGAHSDHGKRKCNDLLNPYTDADDPRFGVLNDFVNYLYDWKNEVYSSKGKKKSNEQEKKFLPHQTVEGIEMTVKAFTGAVKFMIGVGAKRTDSKKPFYLNARVFCQDPLEQYFGKQRARLGGSNNPNVDQFFNSDNLISVHRDLNVRRRSGNTESTNKAMEICDEPLAKRRKSR